MILVEEGHLPPGYASTITLGIQINIVRSNAKSRIRRVCNSIREQIGDEVCPEHPAYASKLCIGLSGQDEIVIEQVDFCCKAFEATIHYLVEN